MQLLLFSEYKKLKKNEFLYESGEDGRKFYFIIKGVLEVIVKSEGSDEFKFSKSVDQSTYFGLKKNFKDVRGDNARVTTDDCHILIFDSEQYANIVSNTEMSIQEKKIHFLIRYVPKFRGLQKRMVEDFEIFFQKEVVTRGFPIQKIDEQEDYLFFIYRGICKIIYPVAKLPDIFGESSFYDVAKQKYLVMGHLNMGDMFGEQSALNDLPNPFTVVAASQKVELYKIHRVSFTKYFGGLNSESVN